MRLRSFPPVAGAVLGLTSLWWAPTSAGGASTGSAILAQAEKASETAASFTMEATLKRAGASVVLHISVSRNGDGSGFIKQGGQTVDLIRIGSTVYFKATQTFWTRQANTEVASLFADKWVSGPVASGSLKSVGAYFDVRNFLKRAIGTSKFRDLRRTGTSRIKGHDVTVWRSNGAGGESTIYIAAGRPHYLYRIEKRDGSSRGTVTLLDYNKPVRATAPAGALTLAKLAPGSTTSPTT